MNSLHLDALSPGDTLRPINQGKGRLWLDADGNLHLRLHSGEDNVFVFESVPSVAEKARAMFVFDDVALTTISADNVFAKAAGGTTGSMLLNFTATDNRLTYSGSATKLFLVEASLNLQDGVGNTIVAARLAKNGQTIAGSEMRDESSSADKAQVSFSYLLELAPGDNIEIWVANTTNDNDITVTRGQVVVTEV